jgi:NTE family protein
VVVGTSAGSVLAAALRCGLDVGELVKNQRGIGNSLLGAPDLGCGPFPPLPSWWLGSPRLLVRALRAPGTVHPWVMAAACLPRGRAQHMVLRTLVGNLMAGNLRSAAPWRRKTWITAVDFDSGHRVAFGRASAPPASMPDAVVASCSVPGWFQPAVIGGRRYIDGGVRSGTNADLLAGAGLDEVYVLAPTASVVTDFPHGPVALFERYVRRKMTQVLRREVALLERGGARVTVLTPGPEDLAVMGGNLMDPRRREAVFETSLATSAAAMQELDRGVGAA